MTGRSHDEVMDFAAFVWIWNQRQGQQTPAIHIRMARWLEQAWRTGDLELLLMAFRNSGKSTLVGLFCAWLLSVDSGQRILVLAADLSLARKMVRNVKRIIERHPLCRGLKPKRADQWAADQFTVRRPQEWRDPSMLAKGVSANLTGSRADVIIYDDVEVPNTCDTAPKRADLRARLAEATYVLVPGGLHLFIGTPHTYYSIYADHPRSEAAEETAFLDGFTRLQIPLLDGNGTSQWPERFPLASVEALRRRSGPNKFSSQMMLQPVNLAEGRLDADRLRFYDHEMDYREGNGEAVLTLDGKRLVSASCWWDPAYGAPGRGDASVIAAVFTDEDGGYWLHRVQYLEHDPDQTADIDEATQLCRAVARFVKSLHLPSVRVETNGLGRFLPGLLRRELSAQGVAAAVLDQASKTNKDQRIIAAFDAPMAAGSLHAHRSVWDTPFIAEMREWLPGGKGRDDGLDAVSGCLLSEPVRLSRRPGAADNLSAPPSWRGGQGSFRAVTTFSV